MPALQGHPRKEEPFETGEKIPQAREECSGSRAGLAKGSREEAAAASFEDECRDQYC